MWRGARPSRTTLDSAKTLIRPLAIGGRHVGFAPRGATKTAARGRLGAYDPPLSFYAVKRHQKTAPPPGDTSRSLFDPRSCTGLYPERRDPAAP